MPRKQTNEYDPTSIRKQAGRGAIAAFLLAPLVLFLLLLVALALAT